MLSQSVLTSMGIPELSQMDISEVSKNLFTQIQWDDILRSGVFLGSRDHVLLEQAQANLGVILDNPAQAKEFAELLIKISNNCTSNLIVQQYVFTRIQEILGLGIDSFDSDADAFGLKHASLFTSDGVHVLDEPFMRALNSSDVFLQRTASVAYALVLSQKDGNIDGLLSWIINKLSININNKWEFGLPAAIKVVGSGHARKKFEKLGGIGKVVEILRKVGVNGNAQTIYELTFILWSISLDSEVDIVGFLSAGTIGMLVDLISSAPSRKVVRMCLGALRNLADTADDDVLTDMFTAGLMKILDGMVHSNAYKQTSDPEFERDVLELRENLTRNYRELSTFERWASQVTTGALRWGIVHTEKFWRENAKFAEANDFKLIKNLITLMNTTSDPMIVCIALYDLGEFTRFYPNGRGVVNSFGGKDAAMQRISSDDGDIQRQALQCVSKIMVTNWEFMR